MNLSISTENLLESERLMLLLIISTATALQEGAITIEESENLLFNPYTQHHVKEIGVAEDIIRIINLGCELENVKSLIPYALNDSIKEIFDLALDKLKSLPSVEIPSKKWIDKATG